MDEQNVSRSEPNAGSGEPRAATAAADVGLGAKNAGASAKNADMDARSADQEIFAPLRVPPWRFLVSKWPYLAVAHLAEGIVLSFVTVLCVAFFPLLPVWMRVLTELETVRSRPLLPASLRGWRRPRRTAWQTREAVGWRQAIVVTMVGPFVALAAFIAFVLYATVLVSFVNLMRGAGISLGDGDPILAGPQPVWLRAVFVLAFVAITLLFAYVCAAVSLAQVAMSHWFARADEEALKRQVDLLSKKNVVLTRAFEDERRRIERELHDGPQQHLASAAIQLGLARTRLAQAAGGAHGGHGTGGASGTGDASGASGTGGGRGASAVARGGGASSGAHGDGAPAEASASVGEAAVNGGSASAAVSVPSELGSSERGSVVAGLDSLLEVTQSEIEAAASALRGALIGLRPRILEEQGLGADIEAMAASAPIPVSVDCDMPGRLDPAVESSLHFVVAEFLANTFRHAKASRAAVDLSWQAGVLRIRMSDDGVGGADPRNGTGIVGMANRIKLLGGRVQIESPVGGPTVVVVDCPVALRQAESV